MNDGRHGHEFDYVIVGGGAAGCALGARLSERPDVTTLVIEAGPPFPQILSVPLVGMREMTRFSWKYFTSQQSQLGQRRISLPFGKVLGGSSSTNAMMYVRGSARAYDRWAEAGNNGWSFAELLPYFRKSEKFEGGASTFHGGDGPVHVSRPRHRAPLSEAFVQACVERGMPRIDDFNCADPEGAGFFHVMQRRGRRSGAASAYVSPVRRRLNLFVRTGAFARRIILARGSASGVEFVNESGETVYVSARREVIVSAGALNSPKLLMQSGIGSAEQLRQTGINPLVHLPGVGANLQDHVRIPILFESRRRSPGDVLYWLPAAARYATTRSGVLTSNCCESGAMVRSQPGLEFPDLQFVTHFQSHLYPGAVDLQGCVMRTYSRGRITLASDEPSSAPIIDPNYLDDPADLRAAVASIRLARGIAAAPALQRFSLGAEILPGADLQSDSQLEGYCRSVGETCYHLSGSCRMGTDAMAVVDPSLRVHGVDRLRIADASIMPELPNGNTCAATYMIAEKAADLLLNGHA